MTFNSPPLTLYGHFFNSENGNNLIKAVGETREVKIMPQTNIKMHIKIFILSLSKKIIIPMKPTRDKISPIIVKILIIPSLFKIV